MAETAAKHDEVVQSRTQAQQLHLVFEQVRRSPYAVLIADALIAYLLTRADLTRWAWVWLALSSAVSFGRGHHARLLARQAESDIAGSTRKLLAWFFAVGLTRAWPIVVAFQGPAHDIHYIVTMIMIGLSAGGVGTAVGMVRIYVAWVTPVALTLCGAWLWLGTFESTWIVVLLVLMFALLVLYVRDYGRTLARQIELAEHLREERDRADSERARAEAERQRAERAIVARNRFFAAASHDLRQPLGALRWYGDAVSAHARRLQNDPLLDIGKGISRALERAEPLVGKYLEISQMDARALEVTLRTCNVATVLEKVRDAFVRDAEGRGLALCIEFGSPVASLNVVTDEILLRNILDNLVGNAIKFTPSGRVTVGAVRIEEEAGQWVRLWIEDTGVGIAASDQDRIFEDFYQVGNPERSQSKGVGLGLAIVRRQAELLHIELRLTSSPGAGSRFEVDLAAAEVAGASKAPPEAVEAVPDGMRVLVIDDEPEVRLALRSMLEAVDCNVRTASGLEGAFAELEQGFRPDALVVDFRLQGEVTGGEVVAELRAAGCTVPAVVVTGDTAPEKLTQLMQTGLPVLHKPVQGNRLIATLVEAVGKGT